MFHIAIQLLFCRKYALTRHLMNLIFRPYEIHYYSNEYIQCGSQPKSMFAKKTTFTRKMEIVVQSFTLS